MPEGRGEAGALLRVAREQGGPALGRLLELYRGHLTLLVRLQTGPWLRGKADASDLVQETFLKAARDFPRFRGQTEAELAGWLRQILATSLAMFVRRYYGTRRRDPRRECGLAGGPDPSSAAPDRGLVDPGSSPSHQASRHEQAARLADALGYLPDDYREVIILRHLEGLTFPEVAHRMSRSPDSVKKLWMRALVQLRRVMGGTDEQ